MYERLLYVFGVLLILTGFGSLAAGVHLHYFKP
jgi:hypothetical protein